MACSDKAHTGFTGQMGLRLGDLASDKGISPGSNRSLEKALRTARAPSQLANRACHIGVDQSSAATQNGLHMAVECIGTGKVGIRQPAQVLIAKRSLPLYTQLEAQLRVVPQLGMGIQWQVIGKQIDVMRQQQAYALLEPTGNPTIHAAPEQAVVHKDGVGLGVDGRLDQRTAGRDAADDAADLAFAFHLQAIGPVVLESFGLQQPVEDGKEVVSLNAHASHCAQARKDHRSAAQQKRAAEAALFESDSSQA